MFDPCGKGRDPRRGSVRESLELQYGRLPRLRAAGRRHTSAVDTAPDASSSGPLYGERANDSDSALVWRRLYHSRASPASVKWSSGGSVRAATAATSSPMMIQ